MENRGFSESIFDNDISNAIENISFIYESYIQCRETKEELENIILNLRTNIDEMKESEKFQIEANSSSKKIIAEQLFTISKLVETIDEMKIYKEEIHKRNEKIKDLEGEIERLSSIHTKENLAAENDQRAKIEEIQKECEQRVQKLKDETDGVIAEMVCNERELNEEISRIKSEKEEQTNVLVLDYEERLQRCYAQTVRMRDEMQAYKNKTNANISVYQKRIEELERKHHPRTNIVAPNNVRSGPPSFDPTNQSSHSRYVSDPKKNDLINPPSVAPPYKLASKQKTSYQRPFNPLRVRITPANSTDVQRNEESLSPVSKSCKRKLFTKHDDEYYDLE